MLIRPLHSDRRLLLVLLTVMATPLFLTAQDRKPAAKTPARTGQPKSQERAKPSANPASLFDQLDTLLYEKQDGHGDAKEKVYFEAIIKRLEQAPKPSQTRTKPGLQALEPLYPQ